MASVARGLPPSPRSTLLSRPSFLRAAMSITLPPFTGFFGGASKGSLAAAKRSSAFKTQVEERPASVITCSFTPSIV
jgi:hypothetical protein